MFLDISFFLTIFHIEIIVVINVIKMYSLNLHNTKFFSVMLSTVAAIKCICENCIRGKVFLLYLTLFDICKIENDTTLLLIMFAYICKVQLTTFFPSHHLLLTSFLYPIIPRTFDWFERGVKDRTGIRSLVLFCFTVQKSISRR